MQPWHRLSLLAAVAIAAVPSLARADFLTLSYPGATDTVAWAIDGNNVVGRYGDATGSHGFIYNGSTYSSFGPAGSNGELRGISGNNVVGIFQGPPSGENSFFYNGSTFTPITGPAGAGYATVFAVSGNTALGDYQNAQGQMLPFVQNGTIATPVSFPGATNAYGYGLSGNTIVGSLPTSQAFMWNGTTLTTLSVPGATSTSANAISGNLVAGTFANASGTHGFIYNGSSYTTFDIPGGSSANITGISGNTVVGFYEDSNGNFHSFEDTVAGLGTPPPPDTGSNPQPPSGPGPNPPPPAPARPRIDPGAVEPGPRRLRCAAGRLCATALQGVMPRPAHSASRCGTPGSMPARRSAATWPHSICQSASVSTLYHGGNSATRHDGSASRRTVSPSTVAELHGMSSKTGGKRGPQPMR